MPNNVTGGDPNQVPTGSHPYPMTQDQSDLTPVVNIPPSAVPPGMATAPHPQYPSATLKVNGESQQVSYEKLVELAQKGVSADSRFQEAATQAKKNESAVQLQADMELLSETGDINAFRRAGAALGLSGREIEESAEIVYGDDEDGEDENKVWERDSRDRPSRGSSEVQELKQQLAEIKAALDGRQVNFGDLSDDVQTALEDVERHRIDKIVESALDSDDVVAYYMNSYDDTGRQAIRNMVDEKIRGRLDASDGKFGDGARILRDVVPEVRDHLKAIGTSSRSTPQMGLGPAPGGQGADIYPTKEPDHVPSTEPGFEEHITQVLAHNIQKGTTG